MQATTPTAPGVGSSVTAPATKPIAMGAALQAISGLDRSAHLKHSGPPRVRYLSAAELSGAAVREKGWRTFADHMIFGTADGGGGGDDNANASSGKTEAAEDVAFSARYVAAVRAIESELPSATRLFDDPYAHVLAGASAVSAVKRAMKARSAATAAQSKPKPAAAPASAAADDSEGVEEEEYWCAQRPFLIIRTRFIDDFVRTALSATSFTQVVILGSGMDTRAYRLLWPSGTRVFELDRPSVVAWKAAQLTAAAVDLRSGVAVHSAGVDLTDPSWVPALTTLPFDPTRPTLWIVEGLLYYFSPAHVTALLANITSLSAVGSRLVADVVNEAERAAVSFRSAVAHPHVLTDATAGDLRGWRLLVPPPSPAAAATPNGEGTDVVQPGDSWCANHGRWTRSFPPLPPGVAGDSVRRAFFVSAVKL